MICTCPNTAVLEDMTPSTCEINLKQLQKFGFIKAGNPFIVLSEDPALAATWTVRKAAVDDTKAVFTPLIGGDPVIEAGDPTTEGGGDNSTLNGVEDITGINPSKLSGVFKGIAPAQEKIMKGWNCHTNLEVVFINQDDAIIMRDTTGDGTILAGFPIQSFTVGDRNNAGYNSKDTNLINFSMASGWSEDIVIVTPEAGFSPLSL